MNIFADMAVIRLTKEFSFEAAHALDGYDGPCREIHGHSYRLFVTVKGCPADDDTNPKCGMVMDFGVLKSIVNEEVVSRFDHALVLRATRRDAPLRAVLAERFGNIVTVDALCAALWDGVLVGYENTLMVHIRRLREKIEDDPSHPRYLVTVRGLGYRLEKERAR